MVGISSENIIESDVFVSCTAIYAAAPKLYLDVFYARVPFSLPHKESYAAGTVTPRLTRT